MARRKYMNGLKRHPSHYKSKSPMLHDSFMNHEHPHKESETLDNVYGNVQMHPDLQKHIKQSMNKPAASQSTSKANKKQTTKNELDGTSGIAEFVTKQGLKRLTRSAINKVPTIGNITKTASKFARGMNLAAMMFDPLSAGEGSTLYTYKDGKKYYNHGPNKGQEVPNSGLF
jgi:cell pole-organizing protein PopZ